MNIKPKLEAEAVKIVDAHRQHGEGIHDLIAKHASENNYNEETVRSLAWLVNRHNYKKAMSLDKQDEIEIANADTVLMRLFAPKTASLKQVDVMPGILSKSASVNSISFNGKSWPIDYAPTLIAKLASRDNELKSEIKATTASIRENLFKMVKCSESIKRAGIESSERFQNIVKDYAAPIADLVDMVIKESNVQRVEFTEPQLRMFTPMALEDTKKMAAYAEKIHESGIKLADCQFNAGFVNLFGI